MNPRILKGKAVIGTEGYVLGELDGIEIDTRSWQANALYVNLSDIAVKELGFRKSFLRKVIVCLPTHLVNSIGDVVTLNEPVRNLQDIDEKSISVNSVNIEGKQVIGTKGKIVGEVEGFDLELETWKVTGLQVGLTDEATTQLGFKRPFFSRVVVIIPSKIVSEVGNFITLDKSIDSLESLVECISSCQK